MTCYLACCLACRAWPSKALCSYASAARPDCLHGLPAFGLMHFGASHEHSGIIESITLAVNNGVICNHPFFELMNDHQLVSCVYDFFGAPVFSKKCRAALAVKDQAFILVTRKLDSWLLTLHRFWGICALLRSLLKQFLIRFL